MLNKLGKVVAKRSSPKIVKINGQMFRSLAGKKVLNKNILFSQCGDIHPGKENGPILFKNVEKLFVIDCNKNFVYYWIKNKPRYPNLLELYIKSHPCEAGSFFDLDDVKIYLDSSYGDYKNRYFPSRANIVVAGNNLINEKLKLFDFEDVIFD